MALIDPNIYEPVAARDRRPLNGEKTHPLSATARADLLLLTGGPAPRNNFNPGVVDRLLREDLVEEVDLPSPYAKHKGKRIAHLRITSAGTTAAHKP